MQVEQKAHSLSEITNLKYQLFEQNTFPISPKCKEVHFKTINYIYPSDELMKSRFKFMVEYCYICTTNLETTEHLFCECETVHKLWKSLHDFISSSSRNNDFWSFQKIQVGVIIKDKKMSS